VTKATQAGIYLLQVAAREHKSFAVDSHTVFGDAPAITDTCRMPAFDTS